jgi:glutamate dehydrogenase/leucine dehydrogenase
MIELQIHIEGFLDVPAGDIGFNTREIGYLIEYPKKWKKIFE